MTKQTCTIRDRVRKYRKLKKISNEIKRMQDDEICHRQVRDVNKQGTSTEWPGNMID